MNLAYAKKLKVRVEIVKTYYVQTADGWIYGGPFDSKEEATKCLKEAKLDAQQNEESK